MNKSYIAPAFAFVLIISFSMGNISLAADTGPRIVDNAGVIGDEAALKLKLDKVFNDYSTIIAIHTDTEDNVNNRNLESFAFGKFREYGLDSSGRPVLNVLILYVKTSQGYGRVFPIIASNKGGHNSGWIQSITQRLEGYAGGNLDGKFAPVIDDLGEEIRGKLSAAVCEVAVEDEKLTCPTTPGPLKDVMCSSDWDGSPLKFDGGVLTICSDAMLEAVDEWVLSDQNLKAYVEKGKYDSAVVKIVETVLERIDSSKGSFESVSKCADGMTADEIIAGKTKAGSIKWSAAILSLIRTLGVPEDRAYIVFYLPEKNSEQKLSVDPEAVVAYQTDYGDWAVIDPFVTRSFVLLKKWQSVHGTAEIPICPFCRLSYSNDFGHVLWEDGNAFGGFCSQAEKCSSLCFGGAKAGVCLDKSAGEELVEQEELEPDPEGCCSGLCADDEFSWEYDWESTEPTGDWKEAVSADESVQEKAIRLVQEASYSKDDAEGFYSMISSWKGDRGITYEDLADFLQGKRDAFDRGTIEVGDLVKIELSVLNQWTGTIKRHISYERDKFDLAGIVKGKIANCFGYSQMLYFTGRAMGLDTFNIYIDTDHIANAVKLSDGSYVVVDLVRSSDFLSEIIEIRQDGWRYEGEYKITNGKVTINLLSGDKLASEILFCKGTMKYMNGEWDEAISLYDNVVKHDPYNSRAYNNRGGAKLVKGMHAEAIADFNRAIGLNPAYLSAYHNRGNAYLDSEEYEKAIADYTKAVNLNPSHAKAYFGMGYAHLMLGHHQEAINYYTKAISLNPAFARAYYTRGAAYMETGNKEKALKDWITAVELDITLRHEVEKAMEHYGIGK